MTEPAPPSTRSQGVVIVPVPPTAAASTSPGSTIAGLQHGSVTVAEGVRLHYVSAGSGEPVLLLPGWPQSWYAWRFVIPLLVHSGRQVFAVDTRGFGDSDMPAGGYDLDTLADDISVLISELGLSGGHGGGHGIDIVSHDTGSWIAHAHAVRHPEQVRRLVVSDAFIPGVSPDPPAGYPDLAMVHRQWHFYFNRVEGLPEALIHGKEREFLTWFFGNAKLARPWSIEPAAFEEYLRVFSKPGAVRAGLMYYREAFSPQGQASARERSHAELNMPVLALGGELADADNLYLTMRRFSSQVEGRVFAGIGHHLPEECPDQMVDEILQFWSKRS